MSSSIKQKSLIGIFAALFVFAACSSQIQNEDIIYYNSFYKVPGITEEEITAIETLKHKGVSFVYGISPSTEAFYDVNGEMKGFTPLLCEWLTELFGLQFIPKLFDWDEVLTGLDSGDIDFTGELTATPKRLETFLMTDAIATRFVSYYRIPGSEPLADIARSRPLRYGFFSGTITYDDVLEQSALLSNGGFTPFFADSFEEAYNMLKSGIIDVFLDEHTSEPAYEDYGSIVTEPFFPLLFGPVSLSTQKQEYAAIISVVQKILHSGGIQFLAELYNQGEYEYTRHKLYTQLTLEESLFIQNNPTIKFAAEHDNYPVSFYNIHDKEFQGICFDVLKEIEKLTGLKFQLVNNQNDDWGILMRMLENGEVSMISELIYTPERENKYLWPQTPLLKDHLALISKTEHRSIKIIELMNTSVGLVDGYVHTEMFKKWFSDHAYTVMYDSFTRAFEALERDEIDMVMASQNQLLIMTNFYELPGYKANIIFDYPYTSTFGFNKNQAVLCSIVDKALRIINIADIETQWKSKTYDYRVKIEKARFPWLVSAIGSLSCLLVLVFYLYFRSRQFEKIQEESESKSIFLANMSHEIRTPMNAITGMAEMLLRGDLSEELRCCAQDIKHAGNNLISIINDILDISKIEAGKLEIVPANYTLSSLVNDTVNIIRARLAEKLIWFETNVDENIPNNLIGDEVRLRQIILNLLSNAVKYTDKGGINFSIKMEKIDGDIDNIEAFAAQDTVKAIGKVWLKISVTDTGKGIKPEDQAKLFNNFVQVDKKKNTGIEGTGLGLAITKRLCDAMNGSISLHSEYGKGSTFTVIIPQDIISLEPFGTLEITDQNYNENNLVIRHTLSFARILVVDDLPVNLKVAEGLLSPYKAKVDTCLSGEEAIELVKRNEYDIVFMDHMMPGMDGIETAARIREFNLQIPIIALTANAVVGMKDMFLQNGFNDFLSKPIDVSKLDEMLERWIGKPIGREQATENNEQRDKSENNDKNAERKIDFKFQSGRNGTAQSYPVKSVFSDQSFSPANKTNPLNTKNKFILFSCVLFIIISIVSFTAYSFSARQINYSHIEQQLSIAGETIRLHLVTTVSSELALVRNLADSPVIKRYFLNPSDAGLESLANAEFSLYEQHFKNKIIFWVNDIDKIFYTTGADPYIVEPDDPEKYWYNMTMYETEQYNFNIDYDRHLQMVNLWVNAPVFVETDGVRKSVGMLGTGIDLTEFAEFVSSGYKDFDSNITPFMFNKFDEITSSLDYELVSNKVRIDDHLGEAGKELIRAAKKLGDDESISFTYHNNIYQIKYIPMMEWYLVVIYPQPGLLALNNSMNMIFFSMLLLMFLMFLVLNIFINRSEKAINEQNKQLIENRKIQAALQAKSDFLGKISHEIRTPINAITGMNEMILRSDIPEEIRNYAKDIKQAGANLTSLINDILSFSDTDVNKFDEILVRHNINKQSGKTISAPELQIKINGVDTAKGIAMTGGKIEKYKQILSVFCENVQERLPLLQKLPDNETLPVFIIHIHSIKGSAATIGAMEISALAQEIEEACNMGNFTIIKEKHPIFIDQLNDLLYNIVKIKNKGEPDG